MKTSNYPYREYAALDSGKMFRNIFLHQDDLEGLEKFMAQNHFTDCFTSICHFSEANRKSKFVAPMYFDLDNPHDLEQARSDAIGLCQLLIEKIKIPNDCVDICFSGHKGFHVEISILVFDPESSPKMLQLYKRVAEKAKIAGVASIDLNIYDSARIWRIPNTVNSKSGYFKIPLLLKELQELNIEGIKKIAVGSRGDNSYASHVFSHDAADWYRRAITIMERVNIVSGNAKQVNLDFKSGWRMLPCIKKIEEATLVDGMRHEVYIKLSRYYAYLGMHQEEMLERIKRIDSRNPVRDSGSITRAIRWSCDKPGFMGCKDPILLPYCKKDNCFLAEMHKKNMATNFKEAENVV